MISALDNPRAIKVSTSCRPMIDTIASEWLEVRTVRSATYLLITTALVVALAEWCPTW
jgi:hypothetical protein